MPAKKVKLNKYGWKPDKPDKRDKYMSSYLVKQEKDLPPVVDLREKMPFVYNQGNLGSCTGQSIAGVFITD